MKYNIENLIAQHDSGKPPKYLLFWGHQPSPDGSITKTCFSQWWIAPFVIGDISYTSAEHWMMAEKARLFNDTEIADAILNVKSPAEAKKLGREVKNFDEAKWNEKRYDIVLRGTWHKFDQHPALKQFLIQTNDRVLVEASPVDAIWGIGLAADSPKANDPAQWRGLNLLGFALMEVRDMLRENKSI